MNRRITALFLIVVPLLFNLAFFALGSRFSYPDILRQPVDEILTRFAAGGEGLVALWYLFALTGLLAIPLALLLYGLFASEHPHLALAAASVGVLAGLVQAMGLFRWVFLVPGLAAAYVDPAVAPETQAAVVVVFEAAHGYLGVAVGEHMGYFFTGAWTILLGVMMLHSTLFRPWLGVVGIVAAVGVMAGLLEPAGWGPAGLINAVSYILWSIWLIAAGIMLLMRRPDVAAGKMFPHPAAA
ncbi:MAG: DUF4386 domain-containing protein [Caldilineaceae bacterium]